MPNGTFEPLVTNITNKLANEGVSGVSEKELLVLVVCKIDELSGKVENNNSLMHKPPWKLWTSKELAISAVVLLGIVGTISWETIGRIILTFSNMSGK